MSLKCDQPFFERETDLFVSDKLKQERARIASWLRDEPEKLVECDGHRHADGKPCLVLAPMTLAEIADAIERGDFGGEP